LLCFWVWGLKFYEKGEKNFIQDFATLNWERILKILHITAYRLAFACSFGAQAEAQRATSFT
jgi:hypothetical protein